MSRPKEPHFFEAEYGRGLNFYWENYFQHCKAEHLVGEARVYNLFLPYVPSRIRESLPDAKLIIILRNPVDRALSHWWTKCCLGVETLSFSEALAENLSRLAKGLTFTEPSDENLWRMNLFQDKVFPDRSYTRFRTYLDMGYYSTQIQRYLNLFPRSQIKILLFDDLSRSTETLFKELCHFLGIDPLEIVLDLNPQNTAFTTAAIPFLKIDQALNLRRILPSWVGIKLRGFLTRFGNRPQMNQETRQWLVEHYYTHNCELEQIIERDLSDWNRL